MVSESKDGQCKCENKRKLMPLNEINRDFFTQLRRRGSSVITQQSCSNQRWNGRKIETVVDRRNQRL